MTLSVETLKSVPRGKAVSNANGGFVSVLLTHLFTFFLFCVFAKATGRTVGQIWSNEGSKRVVPRKEVLFEGLNNVSLNFGGKPPKTEILGA